jgi:VWFA-related protein
MKMNSLPWFCFAIISLMIFPVIGCGGGGGGDGWDPPQVQPQPTADINVSGAPIAFGDVAVDNSLGKTVSVQNTGAANLNIGQIAKAIPSSGPFSLLNDTCSGQSVAPGGTCTFQIRFSPSSEGASNDVFNIPSNDPDAAENPVAVNVSGYGRSLYVSLNELDKTSCPRVKLLMNVNYKNSPLTGLTKGYLSLLENSAARTIETFGSQMEPISVALALDYSDSMVNNIPLMREAAKNFIGRMNPAIQDEAAIIKFSYDQSLIDPPGWTTNQYDLRTAIDSSFSGGGSTALFNTLSYAIDQVKARTKRKAIVIMTDGGNTVVGGTTLEQVIAKAQGEKIPIFTVGLGVGDADNETLRRLANDTGGQFYFAPTADDLNTIYLQIAEILVGQYTLEYTSQVTGTINLYVAVDFNGMTGMATKSFSGCP